MTLSKKIFIVSSAVFAALLILLGVYSLSFKKESPSPKNSTLSPDKNQPDMNLADRKIIPISDEPVISPVLDPEGSTVKYYSKEGRVYQVGFDGESKWVISDKALGGLIDVSWSPDASKVISKFEKEGGFKFSSYDYVQDKGVAFNENIDMVAWQNNHKILYKFYDPKTKIASLNLANADGSDWLKITEVDYRHISMAPVPRTGLFSFWKSPSAGTETKLESISILGGEKKLILREKFGADFLWNHDGTRILTSHSDRKDGNKIYLAVMNARGGEFKNLNVETFVSKAVWSKDNKTVYYALPGSFPENSILPDEYAQEKFRTVDSFWKLNTVTGEKSRLFGSDQMPGTFDASHLFLNADESLLFFVNKADGLLYRINF